MNGILLQADLPFHSAMLVKTVQDSLKVVAVTHERLIPCRLSAVVLLASNQAILPFIGSMNVRRHGWMWQSIGL